MSSLSSASTREQVRAAYFDNASYEEDASVAKAKIFITACRMLLQHIPKRAKQGGAGSEVETDPVRIENQLEEAQEWLQSVGATLAGTSGSGSTRHFSIQNFRD